MLKVTDKFHEIKRIGNVYGDNKGTGFAGNVWDKSCLSPTITTMQGGGREPMIVVEVNSDGLCNCLTTVSKDNLVVECHEVK